MPTTTPFNNLITFSRGSNATLTGPNGLIQWAPNNLLTFSEQMDNATWQKFGGGVATAPAVTANAGVAPDGTTTADRVQFTLNGGTTSTDRSLLSQSATLATSFPYTYSIWVRSLSGTLSMGIGCDNLVGNTPITVTTTWQRFTVSGTATGTAGVALLQLRGGQTPVQSNAADVLVWGAQLELGSTATTYNSTTVKNLLGFSEAIDNAAWTKSGTSIVTGAQANPVNNLFNAQKLMENAASGEHRTFFTIITAPSTYTYSVYLKAAERTFASLIHLTVSPQPSIVVNLTTGAITSPTNVTASGAVNLGNGWWRVWMTYTTTTSTTSYPQVMVFSNATTGNYVGDGNSGVYIYGAQLSDSASLDPYVPTPGAAPSSTAFYGPRFDFDPVTLQPRGLLVEEQRTNLALYSEDFANAAWAKSGSSISANATTAPDGTLTADKLQVLDTSSSQKNVNQTVGAISTTYADTVYAKASELSWLIINQFDGVDRRTWFNLSNGTVGTIAAGTTATIEALPNGWYRCRAVRTMGTGTISLVLNVANADNSAVFVGTVGQGIFIWGAQREAGAFATSYIPTVASTVTRSADVATITGQNFAQWFNAAEGAIVISADTASWASIPIVAGYNPSNTASFVYFQVNTANTWNGTTVLSTAAGTVANNVPAKAATAYTLSTRAITLNGGTVASDANSIGTASVLALGAAGNPAYSSQRLNGHIQSIRFIPARAADFQLQALST